MNKDKLIAAYSQLLNHWNETMDETLHSLAEALEHAKEKTHQSSDLTHDEVNQVSGYVQRDVQHAAQHLSEAESNSLTEWFKFDVELIETLTLDAFASLADKTSIELARLKEMATKHSYHSGNITIAGTFLCDDCGKEIAFKTTSEIPHCPACGGNTFVRL
jgi:hypothetical protein